MIQQGKLMQPSQCSSRLDEWALIAEQKVIEDQRARQYEFQQAQQKRRRLKEYLDGQAEEKKQKYQLLQQQDQLYAKEVMKGAQQVQVREKSKKREAAKKRMEVELYNKQLLSGIVDSKVQEQYSRLNNAPTFDIGYRSQLEKKKQVEREKQKLVDSLDWQVKEKERIKAKIKENEQIQDKVNLSYQHQNFIGRKHEGYHYEQDVRVFQNYKRILDREHENARMFDYNQVELEAQRKLEEELKKTSEKDMEKRTNNLKLKEVLDQQIIIHQQKKEEQKLANPENYSYSLLGRMLTNRSSPIRNNRQYSLELQRQIEENKRNKYAQKYMNQQEYKLNLNQLNRAVEGKFVDQRYIDRSIHTLSDPHAVNVALLDAKVERPDVETIRPLLDVLKNRRQERQSLPDSKNSF